MKFAGDLHTHSIASGHAFGTVEEMGRSASKKGLKYLGITDHGPSLKGAPSELYFRCSNLCPPMIDDTIIVFGCESNIINEDGDLDICEQTMQGLDILLAGFHPFTSYVSSGEKQNTLTLINSIKKNKYIDVVAHIGNPAFKVNYEEIIKCLNDYNVLIEINNRSFLPDNLTPRKGSDSNCRDVMNLCVKYNVPVIVSSDAHNQFQIGCLALAGEALKKENFPENLIITADENKLRNFLGSIHPEKRPKEILN